VIDPVPGAVTWPPRFCADCGHPLQGDDAGEQRVCGACGAAHYRNAKPCAGVLITRGDRLLLARRGVPPRLGTWDVVGGFVRPDEHPMDAARREALEETGLDIQLRGQLGMYVDQYGAEPGSDYTLNIYFLAEAPHGEPVASSDVTALAWFDPDALPTDLAFPHEHRVLADWRSVTRNAAR
jgi:8-oxo-dGTP diphosphatase